MLRRPVALALVAAAAGSHHVHPGIGAAAGKRVYVIARQARCAEFTAAIRADMPVAMKQLAIVERRDLAERLHRHRLALDRNDAARGNAGALPGLARNTAEYGECMLAERPRHAVLDVIETRMLPGDPAMRHTVHVERQDQGQRPGPGPGPLVPFLYVRGMCHGGSVVCCLAMHGIRLLPHLPSQF